MNKVIELKKKVDSLLEKQPALGIAVIIVPFVANIIITFIWNLLMGILNFNALYYLGTILFRIIFEIVAVVLGYYVIYFYTIEKPVFTLANNKYFTFVLGSILISFAKNIIGVILTMILFGGSWYTLNPLTFLVNYVGVFSAISTVINLFRVVGDYIQFYGFIVGILILLLNLVNIVADMMNVASLVFFIVYDQKLKTKYNFLEATGFNEEIIESRDEEISTELIDLNDETVLLTEENEQTVLLDEDIEETVILEQTENKTDEYIKTTSIDLFIMTNKKYFSEDKIQIIRDKLSKMTENQFLIVSAMNYKDPTLMLIFSILFGGLGIDRFMIGDTGMGVLKLLTGGCCGVLTIIDWFTITKKTKDYNFKKFMML